MKKANDLNGVFGSLLPEIGSAVSEAGYHTPSPIQEQAIPPLLEGRDMIGCAQTGTGKTAAFTLPILQYLVKKNKRPVPKRPEVLVLAPTRELAAQIGESVEKYGRNTKISHTVIFGGVGQNPQVKAIRRGVNILVATPGRLIDLVNQNCIDLGGVEIFVLDEADRMLDMGFIHDIKKVIAKLPKKRQSLFFSATMEPTVKQLAESLVANPVQVAIEPEKPAVDRIIQKVMFVGKKNKDELIMQLMASKKLDRVIVFVQMKHVANKVARKLEGVGIAAAAIHGNKSQGARTQALADFKAGKVRALVATDIAARGIDVKEISHVINYDMPVEPETYVHRIGRTARAGAEGDAISFCCAEERDYLRAIEKLIRIEIPVDLKHSLHSESAMNATGADAKPGPKVRQQRGKVTVGNDGRPKNTKKGQRPSRIKSRRPNPRRRSHG
ncbi:ATP-dependent RNA helicase RhlE [Pontiella desulfatans]|uniref:DEAD-box ATP-dependent RNA helicase RhpA n=1 Tax=Pontiella desulfatans TaxID=2750659 RepID=A0A6C2U751_PONDE|nr:DEAD/DEAH box helicase [Pontiella desulfatans]VGO15627.1 ATP-dependent RNA helicase RhlE [Pontiella desulfatans]